MLVTPDTLAYILGGYSHSDYKFTSNFVSSQKETYNGFHVGGGLETKIGSNVTLRAEYRYTGYGSQDWGTGGVIKVSPSSHTGTVGLAWQF
jgi:outer membrane immunogenic protein